MNSIKLSDIDFKKLTLLNHQGSYGKVYTDGDTCYKILENYTLKERKDLCNKFKAIKGINIPGVIFPRDLIISNDYFEGYTMEYFNNSLNLYDFFSKDRFIDINDILVSTKKTSQILKDIHDSGLLLCDFSYENILINDQQEIKICDIDSCRYENFKSYFISHISSVYYKNQKKHMPVYCKNFDNQSLLLAMLNAIYHRVIIDMQTYDTLAYEVNTLKELRPIVKSMLDNPYAFIPYLDDIICDTDHYIIDRDKQVSKERARLRDYRIY